MTISSSEIREGMAFSYLVIKFIGETQRGFCHHANNTYMMNIKRTLTPMMLVYLTILLGIFSCDSINQQPSQTQYDSQVYFNAKVYTVNANQVWAEAFFVEDGIIKYVGDNEGALALATSSTEQIDLGGAMVLPGLHDVHMHPLEASTENFHFVVDDRVINPENYAIDVEDAVAANSGTGWLLGWGHSFGVLLDATRAPRLILDDVSSTRPIAIMEQTSHSVWCNSKALEMMGIDNATANPQGGVIMRDELGKANGILVDNAGNLLLDLALQPTTESEQNDYNGLINSALPELAKHGITSICDARTYWKRNHHTVWKRAESEGRLTVRANLGLWAYPNEADDTQIAQLKGMYNAGNGSLLKINQIKFYMDGIVHNTTAAMHDDYLLDYLSGATNNGLNYFTQERLGNYLAELEATGFDFHIHAIGNRGVHEALNAIENNTNGSGRHRLTHVEFVSAADYARFASLNVTADAQVAGDFTDPKHWSENEHLIGADVASKIIPIKSLHDQGARITLSSDWDVSTLNPFVGLENAVTRSPEELTLEEAIKAYTINAAYVMRQEDKVGSIEVGKEADFIILDRNLFDISLGQIHKVEVVKTYLQGKLVYER